MNARRSLQGGYSLTELLVVVAMIGILSLVSVPQFMNFYRASKMRTAMRQFTSDVRAARQRAITQHRRTAVTLATGLDPSGYARGAYGVWEQNTDGTWTEVMNKTLPPESTDPIYFASTGFTASSSGGTEVANDTRPDIVFLPNGTVATPLPATPTVVLRTDYRIAKPTVTLTFTNSGNFRAVEQ